MTKFLQITQQIAGAALNESIADQVANAADTYLTGSHIPLRDLPIRAHLHFKGWMTKTAAGVATPNFIVRIGATGDITDTARLTLTGPAQTAAADTGEFEIDLVVRAVGATAVIEGVLCIRHNLAATGFANQGTVVVEGTSAAFDLAAITNPHVGLSVDPGAAGAWTFKCVTAEIKYT